jgi:hypothetical protein
VTTTPGNLALSAPVVNLTFYHACRMQGGRWFILGGWLDMLPAQRRVYDALDRLWVLRNRSAYKGRLQEIREAERELRAAQADPDCVAYDEWIKAKRKAALGW